VCASSLSLSLCGCNPNRGPGPAPEYKTLAEAHNARVAQLQQVFADGVIEIRWRDEKGKHFEQGNVELWLQQPSRTALRVEKLGEVLLWVGSDDQRYWFFDMLGDETVLRTADHQEPANLGGSRAFNVRPLTLLDLMGFVNLPVDGGAEPAVQFDAGFGTWTFEVQGRGSRLQMHFDPNTLLPSRIASLSTTGEVALASMLGRYQSVFQTGISPAAFPKMPHAIKIVAQEAAGNQDESDEVALFINDATSEIDSAELGRVFDLDRLIRGLSPDRIERGGLDNQAAGSDSP
jgi:hypothetical protein